MAPEQSNTANNPAFLRLRDRIFRVLESLLPSSVFRRVRSAASWVLFLYRFLCFRHASGRRFCFAQYDAGYRTFATVAVAEIPVRQLRAIHLDSGSTLLPATPHYAFVRNHVDGDMSREPYLAYMTLRLEGSKEQVCQRVQSFERLIDHYVENRPNFLLLIHLISCDTAHILDGFHRAAIVHAHDPNARVRCAIVRPT